MTKHFARVSFWTTWLEVSSRVKVCKIFTSSIEDSINILNKTELIDIKKNEEMNEIWNALKVFQQLGLTKFYWLNNSIVMTRQNHNITHEVFLESI